MLNRRGLECCVFCGRAKGNNESFFSGRARVVIDQYVYTAHICPKCAKEALVKTYPMVKSLDHNPASDVTPESIYAQLSKTVIAQESAKRMLAVAAWQHVHRQKLSEDLRDGLPKNNLLMIGPTGTGKTLLLETLSKSLEVPLITFDMSTVTKAGYVGANAEECISRLIALAGSVEKAAFGIIHLDEVDKIRRSELGNDPGGVAAQQSFLKILEGTTLQVEVVDPTTKQTVKVPFSTKNILFVATGAFPDLYEKHMRDVRGTAMGFLADCTKKDVPPLLDVTSEQMTEFGMIPEFIRRFPVVVVLQPLSESDLVSILRASTHSPLKKFEQLFATMGVGISWKEDFIEEVARRAYMKKIGASGIMQVLEKAFYNLIFELPGCVSRSPQKPILTFTAQFFKDGVPKNSHPNSAASTE